MITAERLYDYIIKPELNGQDSLSELRELLDKYPYFQTARMLYLKNLYLLHEEAFEHELRRSVLFVADRRCLFYFIEEAYHAFVSNVVNLQEIQEKEPGVDSTLGLINEFLGDIPNLEKKKKLRYVFDYASSLDEDTDEVADTESNNDFNLGDKQVSQLSKEEIEQRVIDSNAPIDDGSFTETLAEIYLKQGRYDRAIEIIEKLSLKFPKKNAYFADRIASIKLSKQNNNI